MEGQGDAAAAAAAVGDEAAEQKALAEAFCGITSATREEAVFFLESSGWALDAAIHSFYDDHLLPNPSSPPPPRPPPQPQHLQDDDDDDDGGGGNGGGDDDEDDEDYLPPEAEDDENRVGLRSSARPVAASASSRLRKAAEKEKKKKTTTTSTSAERGRATIRTLADLNRGSGTGSGSDSDSDEEPEDYYTGGEKRCARFFLVRIVVLVGIASGMLVRDPTRGNHDVASIFKKARKMGAMPGPSQSHQSSSRSFAGTGRLLSGETAPSAPQQPEDITHNIYFWSNGFTVNDGPLRRFDDPENASFLESITKSECPEELEPADRRSKVHVNLVRKQENYPEPVKRHAAFRGVGRVLGSGSSDDSIPEPTATVTTTTTTTTTANTSNGLSLDAASPSTSIQLRLADGTRMVARFNTTHTVGDIRAFIDASRPGATRTYRLQTVGFPPKQLDDATVTIEEAGIANSVVIQKL
ncbi:Plant UBX domain-containing protein 4 [Ananas comosus]|uniref:Plant UBX domain-containing protein 4 n=1 Tax=Ananas comosus TaxID=4615 RepID=A0A199UE64_ANACO|nr:Plant UBX domain-containing protein 4 [Ananas comosus]